MKPKNTMENREFKPNLLNYFTNKAKQRDAEKKLEKLHEATNAKVFTIDTKLDNTLEDEPELNSPSGIFDKILAIATAIEDEIEWNVDNIDSFTSRLSESPLVFQFPADEPGMLIEMADAANVPSGVVHQYFSSSAEQSVAQANGLQTVAFWCEPETLQIQCMAAQSSSPEVGKTIRNALPNATHMQTNGRKSPGPKMMMMSQSKNARAADAPIKHMNPRTMSLLTPSMTPGVWLKHKNIDAANNFMAESLKQAMELQNWKKFPGKESYYHWKFLANNDFAPDGDKIGAKFENKLSR